MARSISAVNLAEYRVSAQTVDNLLAPDLVAAISRVNEANGVAGKGTPPPEPGPASS